MIDGDMCLGMGLAMGLGTLVWTVLLVSLVAAATLLVVRAVGRPVQLRADVGDRSDDWAAESELRMH